MFATYLLFFLAICYTQSVSVPQDVADSVPTYLLGKNYTFNVNKKEYIIIMDNLNFQQAIARCESIGLKLVSVETKDESDAITLNLLKILSIEEGHFWTSGTKLATEQWIWLSIGKLVNYTNWGENQPDNDLGNQNCIKIVKASWLTPGSWDDAQCGLRYNYICEK